MRSIVFAMIPLYAGFLSAQTRIETRTTTTDLNGTLVDAACQTTHTERRQIDPAGNATTTRTETTECPVTPATSSFGLLTQDGRFIRFDNPSNTRVVEILRTNPAFSQNLSSSAPLRVRVVGTANGDVAVVESLNPEQAPVGGAEEILFDVRHNDHRGRLVLTATGINFEDLSDAKHSRRWSYAEVKELKRDSGNEIKIEPFSGDSYEFHVEGPGMSESAYNMVGDRIAAARAR